MTTINIKSEILEWNMAGIYIVSSNIKLSALIDTGSYYNLIRPELIAGKQASSMDEVVRPDIISSALRLQYLLEFTFEGFADKFIEHFAAMDNNDFPYDVIIGTRFLKRCKSFNYYGRENRFELVI